MVIRNDRNHKEKIYKFWLYKNVKLFVQEKTQWENNRLGKITTNNSDNKYK